MSPSKLQAWLGRARKDADAVRLVCIGTDATVVAMWPREEATGVAVIEAAQDHCDDSQSPQEYAAQLLAADKVVGSKPIRCRPDGETSDPADVTVDAANANGILAQSLRHNEYLTRLFLQSFKGVLDAQRSTIDAQASEIRDLRQRARAAEKVARQNGDPDDPETLAKAEAIVRVGDAIADHAIPFIAQKIAESQSNGKATVQ